jgi:hypothetical protein
LSLLKTPAEVSLDAKGGEAEYFAVLHMVEMLMAYARPLPAALRSRLVPWVSELERRRERLLQEARRVTARARTEGRA